MENSTITQTLAERLESDRGSFWAREQVSRFRSTHYPWAAGDTSTIIICGSRSSVDEWCVSSRSVRPRENEQFLARFCQKSPKDVLLNWGFSVFIEDWLGFMNYNRVGYDKLTKWMSFKKQRAAIFSNWKVVVDGRELETAAAKFQVS